KGYGRLNVVKCQQASLNLAKPEDLEKYLKKSSSLAEEWAGFTEISETESLDDSKWTHYQLKLKPLDFFMFGSGMGDSDADNVYVSELVVSQGESIDNNKRVLIPGSSVKGAIAHRTAYHYNKIKKRFAGEQKPEDITGCNNEAVAAIFGKADGDKFTRGRILIDDIIKGQVKAEADADAGEKATPTAKTFFHNKIDQFTGGTMDGALFQEKVIYDKDAEYTFDIYVETDALKDEVVNAFEQSLRDICTGLLPLGGITNRGNGIFTGTATKDNEPLWEK
ncbi:MAG TPA: RAMP superfamily CRISPR-associated protein, partial [Muribaculaceae bacterium]|nr:RAMP superfamily CRISPR-associated protein [Muribaculaceae bacterium]